MMRRYDLSRVCSVLLMTLLLVGGVQTAAAQKIRVKTGIEMLKAQHFKCLEGKRVGLVTNPTGVDNSLKSDIDILHEAPNVKLVALFGPEHGVRGDAHAGDAVQNDTDAVTHLPVYSLYGKNRIPSKEMLKGIDVLVYDIQDNGCRSYTYISTLGNLMKAAAANHIEVVVLDRPNPLGGEKVEGNITEDDCISFVSQFKIPYLYGLTCGELARFLNGEHQLGAACRLNVVKMKGWKRSMTYEETGLPWVPTSPHIPQPISAEFYPVSGIVGEMDSISIGVGYTLPFQLFATPWTSAPKLTDRLNALHLPGVTFRPIYFVPFYAVDKGQKMQGVQVYLTDYKKASLCEIQFYVLQEMEALNPEHDILNDATHNRQDMIDKVCGSKQIRKLFSKRHRWSDAKSYWDKDADAFRALSKKYYLYK
jgi:uncharacterized protein YbbC (DUF1343 family)